MVLIHPHWFHCLVALWKIDMVSILPWTLNLTVGKYRRSNPFEMISTLRADVALVM